MNQKHYARHYAHHDTPQSTNLPLCRLGGNRSWPHPFATLTFAVVCLLGAGCGSGNGAGGTSDEDTNGNSVVNVDSNNNTTADNPALDENTATTTSVQNDIEQNDIETPEVAAPVETSGTDETEVTTTNNGESSPVDLLLNEIQLAAIDPLLVLNRKLQGGEQLTELDNNCLGDFDPADGQALDSIACPPDAGSSVYNSDLQAYSVTIIATDECDQLLNTLASNANTRDCRLNSAELLLPVVWVALENPSPSLTATLTPLEGAAISYNRDDNGLLILQSVSDLFVPFSCEIDLLSASLTDSALAAGGCQQQVSRLIGRLFELRTGI